MKPDRIIISFFDGKKYELVEKYGNELNQVL